MTSTDDDDDNERKVQGLPRPTGPALETSIPPGILLSRM